MGKRIAVWRMERERKENGEREKRWKETVLIMKRGRGADKMKVVEEYIKDNIFQE